jgi:hypothetical protein
MRIQRAKRQKATALIKQLLLRWRCASPADASHP